MIDRPARDRMVQAIEDYLEERVHAFEFDAAIVEIAGDSKDHTVDFVRETLWFFYDDCTDHPVVATKSEWDLMQRLILALKSDREMSESPKVVWTSENVCTLATMVLIVMAGVAWGWNCLLLFWAVAPIVLALGHCRECSAEEMPRSEQALYPFSSLAQLRKVYHATSFMKRRYPSKLAGRVIRKSEGGWAIWSRFCLFLAAPLVLMLHAIPKPAAERHII
jgi:hypothetical protein